MAASSPFAVALGALAAAQAALIVQRDRIAAAGEAAVVTVGLLRDQLELVDDALGAVSGAAVLEREMARPAPVAARDHAQDEQLRHRRRRELMGGDHGRGALSETIASVLREAAPAPVRATVVTAQVGRRIGTDPHNVGVRLAQLADDPRSQVTRVTTGVYRWHAAGAVSAWTPSTS